MKVDITLALDMSGAYLRLYIFGGELDYQLTRPQLQNGKNLVLQYLDAAIKKLGINLQDITKLVYVFGPGSFTGIRLGTAVLQPISLMLGLPVLAISSLQLLAAQARMLVANDNILVILDALRDECYVAEYSINKQLQVTNLLAPVVYTKAKTVALIAQQTVITDTSLASRELFEELAHDLQVLPALLAQNTLEKFAPGTLIPLYLKGPHIYK